MALLLACAFSVCYASDSVDTPGRAISLALQYLGIDSLKSEPTSVRDSNAFQVALVVGASRNVPLDDRTPFFHDMVVRGGVWCVKFDNVRLGVLDSLTRSVDVLIDSRTGSLVSIDVKYPGTDSMILPRAKAEDATKQLTSCREVYALADSTPCLSLYDINRIGLNNGLGQIKEFDAQYVRWKFMKEPERLVWIVTFRGVAPISHGKGRVPDWQRNHLRLILDGCTGQLLQTSNFPHTEPPPWDSSASSK